MPTLIKQLTFILVLIKTITSLDSPQFWNLAQLQVNNQQFNFYFGWDVAQTFVYFRIQGYNQGWIALGFGSNLSQMDMIVLRLNSLRVVAEDRFSLSDSQVPDLNTKVKDTFLIKGERNATGYWDATFKRRVTSVDPKKVMLDTSQRYITILLGQSNDEEFTQLSSYKQIFKIQFSLNKICHQTCATNQCTGPSSQECTGCDYFRVLYQNSCILKLPKIFNSIDIPPSSLISNTVFSLQYGYSTDNNYIYFKVQQQNTWNVWMGLMFNNSNTGYTDFYVAYQTSQQQFLVSDYFIDPVANIITEDEVMGDGNNDAFITDSQSNYVVFARKVNTGSQYDLTLDSTTITAANFTLLVGSKDFFESEIQPYQNQLTIKIKPIGCDLSCSSCYFESKQCNACEDKTLNLYGSISLCPPTISTIPTPTSNSIQYILSNNLDSIYYYYPNTVTFLQLDINLRKFNPQTTSLSIMNPRLNSDIDYSAVSLNMNNQQVIFLMCDSTRSEKITSIQYFYDSKNQLVRDAKNNQNIQVISGKCENGVLSAQIAVTTLTVNQFILSLHVDCYDLKQLVLYSQTSSFSLNTQNNSLCNQGQILFPSLCKSCKSQDTLTQLPYCCTNQIYSIPLSTCQPINISYWNKIDFKSNFVKVSYSLNGSIIYFKYTILTKQTDGAFGCGFNKNSVNTDMMIFRFKTLDVQDYFSYGEVIPELDQIQNLFQISVTQLTGQQGFEVVFARNLGLDSSGSSQDADLTNYSGPMICYLGSTPDLSPNNRQMFYNPQVVFQSSQICDSSCQTCGLINSKTPACTQSYCIQGYQPKDMVCQTCKSGYQSPDPSSDVCLPTCHNNQCTQCQTPQICLCNNGYFLYYGDCLPIIPELVYINNFQISFNNLGFSLLYGFDSSKKYVYLNVQGSNQGYIALGFGSHSTFMDIIMIQNSISNNTLVTDMFSQGQIFSQQDTQTNVAYLSGGYNNGFWNITVLRPIISTDSQDLNISLTTDNQVSLVLGSDQSIGYHKASQTIKSQFYYAKAQGGQVNYTNTYIPDSAQVYNKIELPSFNTSLYYGFDKNAQFIYFKLVGMLHQNWFGIGFGNSMTSTDMIITRFAKQSAQGSVQGFVVDDRFSDGQSMPGLDIQQDVVMIRSTNISQLSSSTNSTVEFVRKLITTDPYSEDYSIVYNTNTNQTNPIDLIFAQGIDSDFTQAGHTSHLLMRGVILNGNLDCSKCPTQKCTGPEVKDCTNSTDVSISVYSKLLEIVIAFLVLSLLL
ncbi:DOMON domain protein (macronuclear) [Tetrahymena thermophila SB210]|uniref:DOMON domain protein n=1 Tax=Tetrahymena thermophila (strain SB210) TaxID=312017 RepID=I7MD17_TETTS|nr:DOMON domain protein [Tetrahymena thermophila SB210]EAR85324.2 DOMON domain protein [Tetrahymena thermophila SB210]|eukprot:XP_001032987.2 DOMON domain protein [Tetrahymena thermophila SB210]